MARVFRIGVVAVLLSVAHLVVADDKAAPTALQGRWKLVDAEDSDGIVKKRGFAKQVMVVQGDQMWDEPDAGEKEVRQPFKLTPAKNPRWIDFRTRGEGKGGQERFGIYKLEGARLTICFSTVVPAEESRRPTDFTTKPGSGRVLLVYERVKK
ncbi:MAG: TIGR03067 domain-containing protein [Gemmataceae bacterium]